MRNPCLDEGILQSYYDGELAPEMLEHVASHLASCAKCELLAREVEGEIALATEAFAAELSLSVPTERLRARLDDAIAGIQPPPAIAQDSIASRARAWFAALASSFNLSPQRAIGFASIALFFVLAAVVGGVMMRQRGPQAGLVAANVNQKDASEWSFNGPESPEVPETVKPAIQRAPVARRTVAKVNQPENLVPAPNTVADVALPKAPKALPGEKNYLQAIALLSDAIEANGESTLKPTLLADYKRNLAVVDNAITATQRTARTNPKSSDAAEILYAAYQSKLELLSAVAEQSRPLGGGR